VLQKGKKKRMLQISAQEIHHDSVEKVHEFMLHGKKK
jgi:hypothetical protein